MDDVTGELNAILFEHPGVKEMLAMIIRSSLLGRETISAALGEISEHLIAQSVGGARIARANRGFDLTGPNGERIEVKSRQVSQYGRKLQFNFSKHTKDADTVYCIAWDDTVSPPILRAAYRLPVAELLGRWSTPNQKTYLARTNSGKLLKASAELTNPRKDRDPIF